MKKYNDVVDKLMNIKFIKKITKFDNYLYLVNVDNKIMNIENIWLKLMQCKLRFPLM